MYTHPQARIPPGAHASDAHTPLCHINSLRRAGVDEGNMRPGDSLAVLVAGGMAGVALWVST